MNIHSLSPSMVNQYLQCPAKFKYNYVEKLPRLPNHYLAFGTSFHETLHENYYQKITTARDLPLDLLTDFFVEDLECQEVDWSQQSLGKTKDEGVITVRAYQQEIAPKIQPTHVEQRISMAVNGRPWVISGKIDAVADGIVREAKTTGKRVSKPRPEHIFQTGTYTALWRAEASQALIEGIIEGVTKYRDLQTDIWYASPAEWIKLVGTQRINGEIVYSIRGKDVVCSIPVNFGDSLDRWVLSTFDQVAKGIQLEVWPANRGGSYLCNRKYCDFWMKCEADCGGTVAG